MGFYIAIYLILSIITILGYSKISHRNILPFISMAIIIGIQGLRWKTGTDWDAYYECFEVSDKYQVEYVEFGYYLLNKLIRIFTKSYTVYLLFQSLIMCMCQYYFSKQFGINNISLVLLYFFSIFVLPVRFGLAVSVFLLAYKYIVDRNFIKFFIVYLVATSIHQLIALTLPLYFLSRYNFKNNVLICIYLICCGLGFFTEIVFGNLLNSVNLIFNFLPEFSQDKVAAYMEEPTESASLLSSLVSYVNGLIFILVFLFIRRKYYSESNIYNTLLNLYVFGLAFTRIILNTIPYLARFNLCVAGAFIILVTMALKHTDKTKIVWVAGLCCFIFLSYRSKINSYPDLHIPYYSIWAINNVR